MHSQYSIINLLQIKDFSMKPKNIVCLFLLIECMNLNKLLSSDQNATQLNIYPTDYQSSAQHLSIEIPTFIEENLHSQSSISDLSSDNTNFSLKTTSDASSLFNNLSLTAEPKNDIYSNNKSTHLHEAFDVQIEDQEIDILHNANLCFEELYYTLDKHKDNNLKLINNAQTKELSEEIKDLNYKRKKLDIAATTGIAAACVCMGLAKITGQALKRGSENRPFIIDDIIAAQTTQAAIQAIVPTLMTAAGAYFAWRQFDFYMHSEERTHFVVLENKLQLITEKINKKITTEVTNIRKEQDLQYKSLYKYIHKSIKNTYERLEMNVQRLSDIVEEQKKNMRDIHTYVDENNHAMLDRITRAQQAYAQATEKLDEIRGIVEQCKETNADLKVAILKVEPLIRHIQKELERDLTQELADMKISQESDDEKSQTATPLTVPAHGAPSVQKNNPIAPRPALKRQASIKPEHQRSGVDVQAFFKNLLK